MEDIKHLYQTKAEEIAIEKHGCKFDELPYNLQFRVYKEAVIEVSESLIEAAVHDGRTQLEDIGLTIGAAREPLAHYLRKKGRHTGEGNE